MKRIDATRRSSWKNFLTISFLIFSINKADHFLISLTTQNWTQSRPKSDHIWPCPAAWGNQSVSTNRDEYHGMSSNSTNYQFTLWLKHVLFWTLLIKVCNHRIKYLLEFFNWILKCKHISMFAIDTWWQCCNAEFNPSGNKWEYSSYIATHCRHLPTANSCQLGTDGNGRVLCLWHSVSLNIINIVSVWE